MQQDGRRIAVRAVATLMELMEVVHHGASDQRDQLLVWLHADHVTPVAQRRQRIQPEIAS